MTIPEGIANPPRYRYREEPPATIEVPLAGLLARLPATFRTDRDPGKATVALPCGELFAGNTPRLPAGRFRDLAPDHVRIPDGEDPARPLTLEAGWLALLYRSVTVREELPPDPVETPSLPESKKAPEPVSATPLTVEPQKATTSGEAVTLSPAVQAIASVPEVLPVQEVRDLPLPSVPEETPRPAESSEPTVPHHARRRLLDSLPIFRRHRPERTTLPAPVPSTASPAQELFPELVPAKPDLPAVSTPALASLPPEALASQAALQAIFMSEETFTIQGVVSRAATLPGLRACVLARGDLILATSDSPAGSELRTLSGQAMTLLTGIRSSSVGMGLGSVPAVTLHADGGALSILQEGELCLLVMHSGRGFLPGVRERLQEVLHHLPGTLALTQGAVRG